MASFTLYIKLELAIQEDNPVLNLNNTPVEIWVPAFSFEDLYEVSSLGQIRNSKMHIMKPQKHNAGYFSVALSRNRNYQSFLCHRLIMMSFYPQEDHSLQVNHIDGNKHNNQLSNLEWTTPIQNVKHAISTGLTVYNKPTLNVKKGKSSIYKGVAFDKSRNKWSATVRHNKVNLCQKRFDTEIEAALHYNWIIDTYRLKDRTKNVI